MTVNARHDVFVDAWRLSVGTLTAIPINPPAVTDRPRARLAMVIAPLAVLPLGLAIAAVLVVVDRAGLPHLVTAILAIAAAICGNRALHVDGLSDVADGLTASFDPQRSLHVMKSGTSGPAGVAATVLVLGVQAAAVEALLNQSNASATAALVAVTFCISRAALAICCLRHVPAARQDGLGRLFAGTISPVAAAAVWFSAAATLAAAAVWADLPWWRGPISAAIAGAVVAVLVRRAVKRFGGVTGDVFGAGIELAWAGLLVGLFMGPV